jgi:radial spoke head protein 4A
MGVCHHEEEVPRNLKQELRGKGVNATVFWVTHDLKDDWIQLPDVQPEQINVAKLIKKAMTGNLNAKVDSCPVFPGTERHFLRA